MSRVRPASTSELQARQDERTDALVVVRDDRLAHVVLEGPVALLLPAQPGDRADAVERYETIGIDGDQLPDDSIVSAFRDRAIPRIDPAHARALRERVHEHAGRRRFVVILRAARLVEHLVPEA